jgi:hypothetical protein
MAIKLQAALLSILLMLVTSPVLCQSAVSAGFVADMVVHSMGETVSSKIYVKDLKYRMETTESESSRISSDDTFIDFCCIRIASI